MSGKANFDDLMNEVVSRDGLDSVRPAVEKELLHYDILFALQSEGMLNNLVFQGGTALRLCHGSKRYSEDLDFVGGLDFANAQVKDIKAILEDHIGSRYGLECYIKEPKTARDAPSPDKITVDVWKVVVVTSPEHTDLPRQKIKIEVANVPAHTSEVQILRPNYDFLALGYDTIRMQTEQIHEIMADKVEAFPNMILSHIRNRDIYDIGFMRQKGVKIDPDLIRRKIHDYKVEDYEKKLAIAIERLPEIIESESFRKEMQRFIASQNLDRTIEDPQFRSYLARNVGDAFLEVRKHLYPRPEDAEHLKFQM